MCRYAAVRDIYVYEKRGREKERISYRLVISSTGFFVAILRTRLCTFVIKTFFRKVLAYTAYISFAQKGTFISIYYRLFLSRYYAGIELFSHSQVKQKLSRYADTPKSLFLSLPACVCVCKIHEMNEHGC